nr:ribonuclease H-like domain, reverse transcriptase, RNA-dependent DNA polymerase [Tanacetum cinerariifolium]
MIEFLTKSDASEGFDQIADFWTAHTIHYALMVNPTIYVSCIKQFWASVSIKKSNDVVKLQALINKNKIFIELARMGYEKPSTKLTFYKAFFSAQWKFLIHTIVQRMSAKRTAWNEFSSSMASAVICLATSRTFNFSKYIFDSMDDVAAVEEDKDNEVSAAPTPPSPTPPPPQQEPIPSPPQAQSTQPSSPPQQQPSQTADISESSMTLLNTLMETYANEDVTLVDVDADTYGRMEDYSCQVNDEVVTTVAPITTATQVPKASAPRRKRGVVIQDPEEIAATSVIIHLEVQSKDKDKGIIIKEPKPLKGQAQINMDEAFSRQLEAELNANINWNDVIKQVKKSEKKDNTVMRYQALKRKPVTEAQARKNMMIYLKNMAGFKMNFFKERIEEEVTVQEKEIEEKGSKRKGESLKQIIVKKQRMDEEGEELKRHLQIVANDDDDVYIEATPLASKVPVVDYQNHHENNKPYYKIIRADGTHKLFLSFITLLKNFDRKDLKTLWKLFKERFESTEPKNFSNDFLLNILKIMFEKPNVEANVWRDQKSRYGLAKVKIRKLFESCGVHIITLTTTQMFLLVEKKYPLTHFTLEQMLNNMRLKVEEESEMSLELLRLVRRQSNEGYVLE